MAYFQTEAVVVPRLLEAEVRRWKMHCVRGRGGAVGGWEVCNPSIFLPCCFQGGDKKGFQSDNMKIESFCEDLSEFKDDDDDDDEGFCDDYNPPPRFA